MGGIKTMHSVSIRASFYSSHCAGVDSQIGCDFEIIIKRRSLGRFMALALQFILIVNASFIVADLDNNFHTAKYSESPESHRVSSDKSKLEFYPTL